MGNGLEGSFLPRTARIEEDLAQRHERRIYHEQTRTNTNRYQLPLRSFMNVFHA